MIKYIGLIIVLLLLQGCISKQIAYFEVSPYARVKSDKIDQPLYVRFSNRVNDVFEIKQPGITVSVTQFHQSLQFALSRSFSDLFSDVLPANNPVGFILDVQRMESSWEVKEKKRFNQYGQEVHENDIWCVMLYASTIYRNELLVSQSTGTVKVKLNENQIYTVDAAFKEAVKQACANMAQDHYNKR